MLTMKAKDSSSRIGEIVAEMSSITEFAEGSIDENRDFIVRLNGRSLLSWGGMQCAHIVWRDARASPDNRRIQ